MLSTIGQRFTLFLKQKKISQKQFSAKTGIAEKNVSNVATDFTKYPRSDFFAAILIYYPELDIRWLILGEGEMWSNEENYNGLEKVNSKDSLLERIEHLEGKVELLVKGNDNTIKRFEEMSEILNKISDS